jgi:DNA-directed RNA polymerase specialized sigma24 family protein
VNPPDLRALKLGDEAAWNAAFEWLWPTVFGAAQSKLQRFLPDEVEDTAMEALEQLVEKVRSVNTVDELKPLVATIAYNRAVSLLRNRFAKKRDVGTTESLDVPVVEGKAEYAPAPGNSPLESLAEK